MKTQVPALSSFKDRCDLCVKSLESSPYSLLVGCVSVSSARLSSLIQNEAISSNLLRGTKGSTQHER